MQIYPLQTGTVRCKQFQLTGARNNLSRLFQILFTQKWGEWMPIYCWLIEHPEGLILVDTGETAAIYQDGYLPKGGLYHKVVETRIKEEEEIPYQLAKLGYQPKDISTIIFTHLHGDHIGGLKHFQHCQIFVSESEYQMAISKKGPNNGYFSKNWPSWFQPSLIKYSHGAEGNFNNSQQITRDGKVVVIPTPGHSVGHQSILVKQTNHTTFIAGDLTYNEQTLQQKIPDTVLMNKMAQHTVEQVYQYTTNTPTVYLSSHDWNAPDILSSRI